MPACIFCGQQVAANSDYRQVTGWERISRPAGGTNAIRVPERSQVFACRWCVDKLASGIALGQQTLDSV